MAFFHPKNWLNSKSHTQAYFYFSVLYNFIDFIAGVLFVIGSILFFNEDTTYIATWLFVIGSVFFCLRPATNLAREIYYMILDKRQDDCDDGRDETF